MNFAEKLKEKILGESAVRPDGKRILKALEEKFTNGFRVVYLDDANSCGHESLLMEKVLDFAKHQNVKGYQEWSPRYARLMREENGHVIACFFSVDDPKTVSKLDVTDADFHLLKYTDDIDMVSKLAFLKQNGFICDTTVYGSIAVRLP